ncbi:glycosyltransferase family 2 protein [Stakelama sp. CBK3Z-3]|uniref:Glycosyltransferase family 2 protein n=1 Tax=Stakelama flava TaxID=2860338 RepID=A0ABS6XJA5_9SPHN|nr:glycosyltransferase [Stakelama flava]MBW4330267.1 glycosyltransferase family 2 protein [Stakelama flava]
MSNGSVDIPQDGVSDAPKAVSVTRSDSEIPFRDAIGDYAHVSSRCVFEHGVAEPFVIIAIPTFQRPELLAEAVRSAIAQEFDKPVGIVIVDNDPNGTADDLLARVPEARTANLRYFVNDENIGMFGNWNRCIELAHGEWMTLLNDDDLIDAGFLSQMFAAIRRDTRIDGILCRKRYLDQRPDAVSRDHSGLKKIAAKSWSALRFQGKSVRRIGFEKLFWGGMLGNSAGFLFRPQDARRIGGFYPEEYPAADYWFYIRFNKLFALWQHRAIAASIRFAANESAKRMTLESFMRDFRLTQEMLAGTEVPRWWLRFSPLMIARHRVEIQKFWGQEFTSEEVEQIVGVKPGKDRPWLLWSIRALLRGF